MKILQSEVSLLSSHDKYHKVTERESLEMWNTTEDAPQRVKQDDSPNNSIPN
ncbi:MAG: hypothetical protein U9Q29_07755 [Campylobacterota bacterium]|nr:hypothetical protein [Campylobacterota bacterium]